MKNIFIILCFGWFLVFASCVFAVPVGNPNFHLPEQSALTTSIEVDVINDGDLDSSASNGATAKMEYESFNSALVKIGFMPIKENNLQLYARFGMSELDLVFVDGGNIDSKTGFAWGGGVSGTLLRFWGDAEIGFDLSYLGFNNDVQRYGIYKASDYNMELEYEEFEVALAISKDIGWLTPYFGLKYSNTEITIPENNLTYRIEIENEDNMGLFLGFNLLMSDDSAFNLEARLLDKTAVSIMVHFGF